MLLVGLFLLVAIPLLDGSQKLSKYISLRYTLVCICLIMAIGCVLDFNHLNDESRNIILMGSIVLVGIFVVVRSFEKCKIGSRQFEVEAKKGDASITLKVGKDKNMER